MTRPTVTRTRRRFLLRVLPALIGIALVIGITGPAFAGPGIGGGVVGGGDIGGGNGGGNTGPGNTGGGYVPPNCDVYLANGCLTYYTKSWPRGSKTTREYDVYCPPNKYGQYALGYTYWTRIAFISPTEYKVVDHGYTCSYPPTPSVKRVACSWSATVTISGPYRNGEGVPPANPPSVSTTAAAFQSSQTLGNCNATVSAYNAQNISVMGQYSLVGRAYRKSCWYTDYHGYGSNTFDCGFPYVAKSVTKQAELWCNGWDETWGNHSFTNTECSKPNTGTWQCIQGPTKVNGVPSALPEIQKGQITPLEYASLNVGGDAKNIRNLQSAGYSVLDGSTPNTPGASPDRQLWEVNPTGPSSATVKFWAPSDPNQPFKLVRTQGFTADFLVVTITITKFDPNTGNIVVSTAQGWKAGTARCSIEQDMTAYRARISN